MIPPKPWVKVTLVASNSETARELTSDELRPCGAWGNAGSTKGAIWILGQEEEEAEEEEEEEEEEGENQEGAAEELGQRCVLH